MGILENGKDKKKYKTSVESVKLEKTLYLNLSRDIF